MSGAAQAVALPSVLAKFVRVVDAVNYRIGRFAMYLIFVMGAILLYSTLSRVLFGVPVNWVLEMSQFLLSAYYLLGGAYTLQLGGHVRMDLFYDRLSARNRAVTDAFTILFVIFYLAVLFGGGVSSTNYAIVYGQKNYTAWSPPLWPIKIIMTFGVLLMLLQALSALIKDVAVARGMRLP